MSISDGELRLAMHHARAALESMEQVAHALAAIGNSLETTVIRDDIVFLIDNCAQMRDIIAKTAREKKP